MWFTPQDFSLFAFMAVQTHPGLLEFPSSPGGSYQSCPSKLHNEGDLWCSNDGVAGFFIKHEEQRETKGEKTDHNHCWLKSVHQACEKRNKYAQASCFQQTCMEICDFLLWGEESFSPFGLLLEQNLGNIVIHKNFIKMHSFSQQIFFEQLLHSRHCSGFWVNKSEQNQ